MRFLAAIVKVVAVAVGTGLAAVLLTVLVFWPLPVSTAPVAAIDADSISPAMRAAALTENVHALAARQLLRTHHPRTSLRWHLDTTVLSIRLWIFVPRDAVAAFVVTNQTYGSRDVSFSEQTRRCFGVEPSDVDVAQAATLIAIARAPSAYRNGTNADRLIRGRSRILDLMVKQRSISAPEAEAARVAPLGRCWG